MTGDDGFSAFDFYTRFYDALPRSPVYAEFCRRLYGADLGQHGFADMAQIDALLAALALHPGERALDLGCGDGRIAEYIADRTAAQVTGLDLLPNAVAAALARTETRRARLNFRAGDIARLDALFAPAAFDALFAPAAFDALIAIDSLYFSDLAATLRQMKALLSPAGRMAIFYSHAADPWRPPATFPRETLPAERGPLAAALTSNGLAYRWWDFTAADYEHAQRKTAIVEALRPAYRTPEDEFLCECRMGEAQGVIAAHEAGCHARHLFLAWVR